MKEIGSANSAYLTELSSPHIYLLHLNPYHLSMNSLLINIDVPDIEKAVSFYTSALPLTVGRRFDSEFVELVGLPSPIYLLQKDSGTFPFPDAKVSRSYEPHWSPVHMDFVVENIEETRTRLLAAGASEEAGIVQKDYGKIAMFRDPFGHGLCVIQFTGEGYNGLINS